MELLRNGRPRVVITGLGAITPLGTLDQLWENVKAGVSGIRRLETIDVDHVPVKFGGEVRNFDSSSYIPRKEARRMGRATQFAISSAHMAVADAGLTQEEIAAEGERVGVIIGTALGSFEVAEQAIQDYRASGYRRPNPTALISCLPNMPAHYTSKIFQALGPLSTPSTACAAGTQAIGDATDLIRMGRADMFIAGGVEAILQDYTLAGFHATTALASGYDDEPERASRPFDLNRSGFVFSEGCAILILENLSHALKRNARIYAEVLGYGCSADAYHFAALNPEGSGAARCMNWALDDARLNPEDIQYINAHGTSTQANDAVETLAIKKTYGDHAYRLMISSTKSMLGHAMGATGAVEALVCAKTMADRIITPTINLDTPDPDCDLDYTPHTARDAKHMRYLMSNSFGLGGQNAAIIMGAI
jgi:3-oxoacyl-[acyl-carrier-protein] synthase II